MTKKRIFALVLAACMMLTLCACGDDVQETQPQSNETTAPAVTTAPTQETTVPVDDGKVTYTVYVVDEGGNPIPNAMVQLCLEACIPGFTDESGKAEFRQVEADYKVSFVALPAGYEHAGEATDFYFDAGSYEMTITLKAVA